MQAARLKRAKTSLIRQSSFCKAMAWGQFAARQSSYNRTLSRGTMQAGPAIQPTPPISMTAAGIWAEAENTRILSPQRLSMDKRRPVLVEASLM